MLLEGWEGNQAASNTCTIMSALQSLHCPLPPANCIIYTRCCIKRRITVLQGSNYMCLIYCPDSIVMLPCRMLINDSLLFCRVLELMKISRAGRGELIPGSDLAGNFTLLFDILNLLTPNPLNIHPSGYFYF